jgi:hypothetical protein
MSTYKVKTNIKHDGELYTKGQSIELDPKIAKPLIRDGVITSAEGDVDAPAPVIAEPNTKAEKEAARQAKKNEEAKAKALAEAEANADGDNEPEDDGLEALTIPKLLEVAEAEKIKTVKKGMAKDDIVEAIRVARVAKKNEEGDEDEEETDL